jgi:hypothetical protein
LEQAQLRLFGLWKQKQMVSRRLLGYDTTNSSFERQVYVMLRRLPGFLDKAVKQNHALLLYAENNPRGSAIEQAAPDFPQFAPERANQRHANRP